MPRAERGGISGTSAVDDGSDAGASGLPDRSRANGGDVDGGDATTTAAAGLSSKEREGAALSSKGGSARDPATASSAAVLPAARKPPKPPPPPPPPARQRLQKRLKIRDEPIVFSFAIFFNGATNDNAFDYYARCAVAMVAHKVVATSRFSFSRFLRVA